MSVVLDARKERGPRWPLGSHHAHLERTLSTPDDPAHGGRHPLPPLPAWRATLGRWGIGPDTDVVVTDDQHGGLAAARCWWMLRAVGHDRVRVVPLDDLDVPWTDTATPPVDGPSYPDPGDWLWPTVSAEEVERRRLDPSWRLVDARASVRHTGQEEPLDPVAGHIPGSVNLPWEETTDPEAFRARYAAVVGDVPSTQVIVHCGSGVTACHTLLQLDRLGLGRPALYVGSWSEWCRQPRPRSTGP